jgi:hypothetical protein
MRSAEAETAASKVRGHKTRLKYAGRYKKLAIAKLEESINEWAQGSGGGQKQKKTEQHQDHNHG